MNGMDCRTIRFIFAFRSFLPMLEVYYTIRRLFFLTFLLVGVAKGQISVSALAVPAEASLDEYINYKIIIENTLNVEEVIPPSLRSFSLVSPPTQQEGINNINGQISRYIAIGFILKPVKRGRFTIDPAKVRVGNKWYKSLPVTITVTRQSAAPGSTPFSILDPMAPSKKADFDEYILREGEPLADKVNKNMELKLKVDKTTCYVGEPVVAAYQLYSRLKSESKLVQNPSFNGFSVIDLQLGDGLAYATEQMHGKPYHVYMIRKSQLYALQPGDIELEPAELENNLQFLKEAYAKEARRESRGFFDDFSMMLPAEAFVSHTVNLTNKPVTITVKPLPETGKPVSFNGAVGKFSLSSQLQKEAFTTDESGVLTVTINGSGNMQLLTAPDITWPAGIEPFEPKVTDQLSNNTVPVSGSKTFEFSFAVNQPGQFTLPAITFSYFDPSTAKYHSLQTKEIIFSVKKGDGNKLLVANDAPVKAPMGFVDSLFTHRWRIIVFLVALLLSGLLIGFIYKKKKIVPQASNPVPEYQSTTFIDYHNDSQLNHFSQTAQCLQKEDCDEFYALAQAELNHFLLQQLSLKPGEIDTQTVSAALDKRGVPNETVLQLQQLMREIEWQRYTPFERTPRMHSFYEQIQEITRLIKTYTAMRP